MLSQAKDRRIAALLALVGAIPLPIPGLYGIAGLHKFYLGQPRWGIVYVLLSLTPIPAIASVLEGLWYLFQDPTEFSQAFSGAVVATTSGASGMPAGPNGFAVTTRVTQVADALRQLDDLRQDGLMSDYEFEQKRRQLLDQIG